MSKKINIPKPQIGLKFIDVHCHLPFPRPRNDKLPPNEVQYSEYFKNGGLYLITSSIDMNTLNLTLKFMKNKEKMGFTCGWAPQTVTYTPKNKYHGEWKKWIEFIESNTESYSAIGEIGLDFHHAKTLEKKNKQVEEFKKILEITEDYDKPYVLHVRNAARHEHDKDNPDHQFNKKNGANMQIIKILNDYKIRPERVMWHCFSGPEEYGKILSEQGYTLSVPSSAFGYKRWRDVIKDASIESLVTETDSYYQHPYKRGPFNVPSNVRYSISAIAHVLDLPQAVVSEKTVKNAIDFFKLEI